MKKNMRSVVAQLTPIAESLPTQSVAAPPPPKASTPAAAEPTVQFSFSLRKSLRKELARLADDADMTMRAFILDALKEKGLTVLETDLQDLRRQD